MADGGVWANVSKAVRVVLSHRRYELTGRLTQLHNERPFLSR